jgi:ABC-2 type transport system ATP-binding protein
MRATRTVDPERLSDRLAILDDGRVVALDTPGGLVARVDTEQRIRFKPSAPFDDRLLTTLPHVTAVSRRDGQVLVRGDGDVLHEVTSALALNRVVAHDLRVEQASLDEAFVSLTGRPLGS